MKKLIRENIQTICWPASKLGDGLSSLAQRAGLHPKAVAIPVPPARVAADEVELHYWLDSAAAWLDIEAEPVESTYAQVMPFLKSCGPALVQLDFEHESRFLAVVKSGRG